jgi:hypothetical protein
MIKLSILVICDNCQNSETLSFGRFLFWTQPPLDEIRKKLAFRKSRPWRFMPNDAAVCYDCITGKDAKELRKSVL